MRMPGVKNHFTPSLSPGATAIYLSGMFLSFPVALGMTYL